jgi:DNA-binding CsgD family transcriptional regulator
MRRYGLYEREREFGVLDDLICRLRDGRGSALVITGEAGIGKSALLAAAARRARSADPQLTILYAAGVRSESQFRFAGLHRLLQPVLHLAGELPAPRRLALQAAFGLADEADGADEADADLLWISLATLTLIGHGTAGRPALLIADDVQWLDEPTRAVLGFVARRLGDKPVLMLAAARPADPFETPGLPELPLPRLGEHSARALLDRNWPALGERLRERVLATAAGNPLALAELPASEPVPPPRDHAPVPWPGSSGLTARLERAFGADTAGLPDPTGWILLILAADDQAAPAEVLEAASLASGATVTMASFWPATRAGLVELVELRRDRIAFRHPLLRLAIYQGATQERRLAAHAALAEVLAGQPDRQVWHLAASAIGPDEQVATALDQAAIRAERRGAVGLAATAMERAAELSSSQRRLRQPRIWADWAAEARIGALIATADRMRADGHPVLAAESLHSAALRCWWGTPDAETRTAVISAVERTGLPASEPAVLAVLACADPLEYGAQVASVISGLTPDAADPAGMYLIGTAAGAAWCYDLAPEFLDVAVTGLRAQGQVSLLAQALVAQAWTAVHLADGPLALSAAAEADRLARDTGQLRWAIGAQFARAAVIAQRGDLETAEALCAQTESMLPSCANPMLAIGQYVRGHGAVANQHYAHGARHLARIRDEADPAFHPIIGTWGLADLTEAAVHSGDIEAARCYLAELESLAGPTRASMLQAEAGYARTLVAGDDEAGAAFQRAIERDLGGWPCFLGRAELGYGRWLRRQRRVAESRGPLRAARDSFDARGLRGLAECARQELRAAGETSRRAPEFWDQLTARELQIARMAASGMSNRDIGRDLYISHRTVGYHLHRIFPKLGITSRSQLHAAVLKVADDH